MSTRPDTQHNSTSSKYPPDHWGGAGSNPYSLPLFQRVSLPESRPLDPSNNLPVSRPLDPGGLPLRPQSIRGRVFGSIPWRPHLSGRTSLMREHGHGGQRALHCIQQLTGEQTARSGRPPAQAAEHARESFRLCPSATSPLRSHEPHALAWPQRQTRAPLPAGPRLPVASMPTGRLAPLASTQATSCPPCTASSPLASPPCRPRLLPSRWRDVARDPPAS